ncbi:MAG: hypothetical protein LBQ10_07235 [Desulfovibrio sp.]|nr:hypothetical protein [Desulfovibrio sp.]
MNARLDAVRADIREKYRSTHAFCRANPELKRSTVYLVLSGKYPGNNERQTGKIEEVLTGETALAEPRRIIQAQEAFEILQGAKCAYCRKRDKRACPECKTQTTREAQALETYLHARGKK